jgi:hypothetical protein
MSEILSEGRSLLLPLDAKDRFSCVNMDVVHGADYVYHDDILDMTLVTHWTVLWDNSTINRDQLCLIPPQQCDKPKEYVGRHIGYEELETLHPIFRNHSRSFLVFNMADLNAYGSFERMSLHMAHFGLTSRSLYLADPIKGSKSETNSSVSMLDLKPHFKAYDEALTSGMIQPDITGKPREHNHLYAPLQKHLVRFVTSHIAFQLWLQSPNDVPPLPLSRHIE